MVDTYNVYFFRCIIFTTDRGGRRLSGSPRNPNKCGGETRLIKECFFATLVITCVSRVIIKMKVKKMGAGYIFLGFSVALDSRTPALIYSWSRKCEFLPFSRQRARTRYNGIVGGIISPVRNGRLKDFPEQRHIIEKEEMKVDLASSGWNTYFHHVKLGNSSYEGCWWFLRLIPVIL